MLCCNDLGVVMVGIKREVWVNKLGTVWKDERISRPNPSIIKFNIIKNFDI